MTISYRMLAAIVGVVLLFGVAAAFVVDGDDDDADTASNTTVTVDRNDEGGVKTEDDDDGTTTSSTSSTSSSTTATTTGASTTSTTAGGGATTSTTRRSGSATTTTRPRSTTTTPPTTPPTNPPVTNPPTTTPRQSESDLLLHASVTGTDTVRVVTITVEHIAQIGTRADFTVTASGAGAPIRSVHSAGDFPCTNNGSSVNCSASNVGPGGRVREVTIEFGVDAVCTGLPVLTASITPTNGTFDPNPGNNAITPRSLCPAAGNG